MTTVFPSPKESTTPLVNSFDDSFGDVEGRHIMKGERTENRGADRYLSVEEIRGRQSATKTLCGVRGRTR
jgi:hypothetical protein